MNILTKVFTIFTQVMVKLRLEWEKNKKILIVAVPVSLIVGILIGWILFGRILFPVPWDNVSPAWMRADFKTAYIASIAEDYASNEIDVITVKERLGLDHEKSNTVPWTDFKALKADVDYAVAYATNNEDINNIKVDETDLLALKRLQGDLQAIYDQPMPAVEPEAESESPQKDNGKLLTTLAVVFGLAALGFVAWYLLIGRESKAAEVEEIGYRDDADKGLQPDAAFDASAPGAETRLEPFNTPYIFGDDYFDPSFSIEVGKNFLGECGIGISEVIEAGDPKKVTAFEAWLFDKSDIRTITTILASPYAGRTPGIKDKLEPKGEVQMIEEGQKITLETTSLRVVVTIKELEYAPDGSAPDAVFQKVNFELQAWVKPQPEVDGENADDNTPVLPGMPE